MLVTKGSGKDQGVMSCEFNQLTSNTVLSPNAFVRAITPVILNMKSLLVYYYGINLYLSLL